jgi:hypothetical protein
MERIEGELCNGVAYIDWSKLHSTTTGSGFNESPIRKCFGQYRKFNQPLATAVPPTDSTASDASTKYVRAIGSTAILYSPVDSFGNRRAVAKALGPFDTGASEVGPIEEAVLEWSIKLNNEGAQTVIVEPTKQLFDRSWLVARRSFSIFSNSINPISTFISKMRERVPELVKETYEIATSIKIEIKIEDPTTNASDSTKK